MKNCDVIEDTRQMRTGGEILQRTSHNILANVEEYIQRRCELKNETALQALGDLLTILHSLFSALFHSGEGSPLQRAPILLIYPASLIRITEIRVRLRSRILASRPWRAA